MSRTWIRIPVRQGGPSRQHRIEADLADMIALAVGEAGQALFEAVLP